MRQESFLFNWRVESFDFCESSCSDEYRKRDLILIRPDNIESFDCIGKELGSWKIEFFRTKWQTTYVEIKYDTPKKEKLSREERKAKWILRKATLNK